MLPTLCLSSVQTLFQVCRFHVVYGIFFLVYEMRVSIWSLQLYVTESSDIFLAQRVLLLRITLFSSNICVVLFATYIV